MPAKDHAAWDIVTVLARTPSRLKPVAADEYRPLALDRTAFLNPEADPTLIREAYEQRTKSTDPKRLTFAKIIGIVLQGFGVLVFGLFFWIGSRALQLFYLVVLSLSLVTMYARNRNLRMLRRTKNRFLERHCPDCDYDLSASHADPPLDPESLGINLGPRHCPECGAFWPLVPPETPPQT